MRGSSVTRRVFLTGAGAGALGILLAACSGNQTAAPTSAPAAAPTTAPASNAAAPTAAPTSAAAPTTAAASSGAAATTPTTAAATNAASTTPASQGAPSGNKSVSGSLVWLVRSDPVENKGQQQIFEPMLKAQLPNVTINRVIVPQNSPGGYNAKILTLAAAKQGLDLWGFGQNYMDFWARGMPQSLNSYIDGDKWDVASYFLPGLSDVYNVKGNHYGLPQLTCYGSMCVYNQDLFKQAGLTAPPVDWNDTTWTWDKALEYAQKLTKNAGTPDATYGLNIGLQKQTDLSFLWGGDSWLPEHYTNFIAPKTNFNNPANLAGHQFIQDLMYKYKVHPDPATSQGMNQLGDAFHTGRVAMNMDGGWLYWSEHNITNFKVGFAALPMAKTNKQVDYDDQWIMGRWSTNKDAVWQVMRVLTSVDATSKYSAQSGTPPTPRESTDPWLKQLSDFSGQSVDDLRKVTLGAIEKKDRTQESPDHLFIQWPNLSTTYSNKAAALWNNSGATADKVLPDVTTALDQIAAQIYNQFKDTMPSQ